LRRIVTAKSRRERLGRRRWVAFSKGIPTDKDAAWADCLQQTTVKKWLKTRPGSACRQNAFLF
jgi:hypothetical protein